MLLDSIEANNFRNLSGKIVWGSGLNIIYGNNGQGKTNWLEAIHILSRTKSFRTQRLQEAIRFGEQTRLRRRTGYNRRRSARETASIVTRKHQDDFVNGKRETLARYLGLLQVFSFTADQLEVVRGMPEARRHFIDRGISSLQTGLCANDLRLQQSH